MRLKKGNPKKAIQPLEAIIPETDKMNLEEAINYLDGEVSSSGWGWSIRYYGFGKHLVFWVGDGGFIDFGINADTKITFDLLKKILVESAMARRKFNNELKKKWNVM